MKNELKKDIPAVLEMLQARDPAWKHVKMLPKFKELYQAWAYRQVRHGKRNKQFYSVSWRRKWLPIDDFRAFRDYAMQ